MKINEKTLKVVDYINKNGEGYLSEITRVTKMSKPTVLKILSSLHSEDILKQRIVANSKIYSINHHNMKTKGLFMLYKQEDRRHKGGNVKSAVKSYLQKKRGY